MKVEYAKPEGYENLFIRQTNDAFFVIVIHNSALGNPLGGTRMMKYSGPAEAIEDARRLAHGMTYKFASTSLPFGGGKATINPLNGKKEKIIEQYARFLCEVNERLSEERGRIFITGEDIGIGVEEVDRIRELSKDSYVVGSSSGSNDPSPYTARGVYESLMVCLYKTGLIEKKENLKIKLEGAGKVGSSLLELLAKDEFCISVTDIDEEKIEKLKEKYSKNKMISFDSNRFKPEYDFDIFVPCAVGGTVTRDLLKCKNLKIVCGSANNQLDNPQTDKALWERKILYAPDYVVNSAGAIRVGVEALSSPDFDELLFNTEFGEIKNRVGRIIHTAEISRHSPLEIANMWAEERISISKAIQRGLSR